MTEKQIPKFVACLVEHQSEFAGLATADAQWAIQNPKEAVALFVKVIQGNNVFLVRMGTVNIQPMEKFVARDHLKVNIQNNTSVKMSWLGEGFTTCFLDKIEETRAKEIVLHYHALKNNSTDAPIIVELGSQGRVETTLAEIFALMQMQGSGENGALLTNGHTNIFYVLDSKGLRRSVCLDWAHGGWSLYNGSDGHPSGWSFGDRVFSRSS